MSEITESQKACLANVEERVYDEAYCRLVEEYMDEGYDAEDAAIHAHADAREEANEAGRAVSQYM